MEVEQTYWNGEPCEAHRVTVVVADAPAFPKYWARPFIGTERNAVRVTYNDDTFYLDDEGYEQTQEAMKQLRRLGLPAEPQVGYPGWGWDKVTKHFGGPQSPHASLEIQGAALPRDVP
jgi:hypothetical protein